MTWRTLLASFVAASGLLFAVAVFFSTYSVRYSHAWFAQSGLAAIGLIAFVVSYFVYRGHYWTLWVLRVASVLAIVCLMVLAIVDYSSTTAPIIVSVAFYLWILGFPAFFLALLLHRQVVAEFSGQ